MEIMDMREVFTRKRPQYFHCRQVTVKGQRTVCIRYPSVRKNTQLITDVDIRSMSHSQMQYDSFPTADRLQ